MNGVLTDREALIEIKAEVKNISELLVEQSKRYEYIFADHSKRIEKTANDAQAAFGKIHAGEKNLTKNDEATRVLGERVEKLELAVAGMKETLVKTSVISNILTVSITALVVKYFSG